MSVKGRCLKASRSGVTLSDDGEEPVLLSGKSFVLFKLSLAFQESQQVFTTQSLST